MVIVKILKRQRIFKKGPTMKLVTLTEAIESGMPFKEEHSSARYVVRDNEIIEVSRDRPALAFSVHALTQPVWQVIREPRGMNQCDAFSLQCSERRHKCI